MKYSNRKVSLDALRISDLHWDRNITEDDIAELANNIEKYGNMHPMIVRPFGKGGHMYEVLAGQRRLTALTCLGAEEVDVRVVRCSDLEAEIISYSENLKTKKPNSSEWDAGLCKLVELHKRQAEENAPKQYKTKYKSKKPRDSKALTEFRDTVSLKSDKSPESQEKPKTRKRGRPKPQITEAIEKVAREVGVSERTVRRSMKRHADLIPSASRALEINTITQRQADKLATMPAKKQQQVFREMVIETREARERRKRAKKTNKSKDRITRISDILSSALMDFRDIEGKLDTVLIALADNQKGAHKLTKVPNYKRVAKVRDALNLLLELVGE